MSPVFNYVARSKSGEQINGTLEADNSSNVASQLREKGYYVTDLDEQRDRGSFREYLKFSRKVKIKDLSVFSQQFAAMIDAGISLVEALEIMQKQISHPELQKVVLAIQESVETGSSLAESMSEHPDIFPSLYVQLVRAGETGGVLDQVLNKLAAHYERQDELSGMVKSALYYPITILIVAVVVVVFLLLSVVPQFVGMFEDFGAQLPLPTRILLGSSTFLQTYWWGILIVVGLLGFFAYYYKNTPRGEIQFDKLKLKIPIIGNMLQKVYVSRFASTLAILMDSGVDLLSSLAIVEDVVGNRIYSRIITEARIQVREGVGLSSPLSSHEEFPPMVVQMIKIGEETGAIGNMLNKVSTFYDREVESSVDGAISLIEPIMIVMLAVVVGFVAVSIVTPMFDMFQYF